MDNLFRNLYRPIKGAEQCPDIDNLFPEDFDGR
jgi:hypothetical protein